MRQISVSANDQSERLVLGNQSHHFGGALPPVTRFVLDRQCQRPSVWKWPTQVLLGNGLLCGFQEGTPLFRICTLQRQEDSNCGSVSGNVRRGGAARPTIID